ncbi:MAG: AAA family ATPase [Lachnospiraceae bacterium]|nr:AAA family ATPase [Lachnospiraceae bacterium]
MWKITHLRLENITYIFSGLHKDIVDIDFTKPNLNSKLNLIVGPMGSGKSVILGHLQPFASFGTLDSRNSKSMVPEEMDGLKIIEYDHDEDHYYIEHRYIWNKSLKSHATKSYFQKNGVELNSNGNSSSFKELVKLEFGIDQNFLRILRLGPNVSNVISMKSTERKKFIASLQSDTELYLMLAKKLSAEYNGINSTLNAISNRLMRLSAQDETKMRDELESLQDIYRNGAFEIDQLVGKINQLTGTNQSLWAGTLDTVEREIVDLHHRCKDLQNSADILQEKFDSANAITLSLTEISNQIAKHEGLLAAKNEQAMSIHKAIEEIETQINQLNERVMMHDSNAHLDELKRTLIEVEQEYTRYATILSGFTSKYSYSFLASFIDSLPIIQSMIDELAEYEPDVIEAVMKFRGESITAYVNDKCNKLTGRKINLQRALNNLQFSAEYQAPYPLFRAPMCPTKDCPYYRTHPDTIQRANGNTKELDSQLMRMQDEIARIDKAYNLYAEYPIIQKKLQMIQAQLKQALPVLTELKAIGQFNLMTMITNPSYRTNWYNYNRLIDILEKCKMQSEFEEVASRYTQVKNEVAQLESGDYERAVTQLASAKTRYDELNRNLDSAVSEIGDLTYEVSQLEDMYKNAQQRDEYARKVKEITDLRAQLLVEHDALQEKYDTIMINEDRINSLESQVSKLKSDLQELQLKIDQLKSTLNQIEYNQNEYKGLVGTRDTMKYILDAISTKDGIPLIMVKSFLDNCREIVNDLIADVFDEDLEILDFVITENEFKIPYMVNGRAVEDIEYASQGQQSIISIALSFALVRRSMFDYNIMLLDEIDGPLYKEDREKFISILFKQMAAIGANQVFLITHNNTFEGNPVNILTTSEDELEHSPRQVIIQL